jgi:hypothetical protein
VWGRLIWRFDDLVKEDPKKLFKFSQTALVQTKPEPEPEQQGTNLTDLFEITDSTASSNEEAEKKKLTPIKMYWPRMG